MRAERRCKDLVGVGRSSHLLQTSTNFLAEHSLEGVFLHADDMDGLEFTLGHSDNKLHTDEGASDDDEVLAFLTSY